MKKTAILWKWYYYKVVSFLPKNSQKAKAKIRDSNNLKQTFLPSPQNEVIVYIKFFCV